MVEFGPILFHSSDQVCCYCDETVPAGEVSRVAEFQPLACGGSGMFVDVRLYFCQPCLRELAVRANNVADQIQRNIDDHARWEAERLTTTQS